MIPRSIKLNLIFLTWIISLFGTYAMPNIIAIQAIEFNHYESDSTNLSPSIPSTSAALSSGPNGEIVNGTDSVFWFIHITDTQNIYLSNESLDWFHQFLNETAKIIDPKFIINTGDLVASDYHGFFRPHDGQLASEWIPYNTILTESGYNKSNYYDVMGNHDCYADDGFTWYRNYSIQQDLYYDFTVELPSTPNPKKYHFVGLHTEEEYGIRYPMSAAGYLNETELDWYENVLGNNQDADVTIAFAHHPAYEIMQGGTRFFDINREYGLDLFLVGHGHYNTYEFVDNRIVSYETASFEKEEDCFRIIAIDNNTISTSIQSKDEWPVSIITAPSDYRNVYSDFDESELINVPEIRALAWDPMGVIKVEWRATKSSTNRGTWTEWEQMSNTNSSLYGSSWNDELEDGDKHIIQIRVTGGSGVTYEQIEYQSKKSFIYGWYITRPLIIIGVIVIFSGVVGRSVMLRKKDSTRNQNIEEKYKETFSVIKKILMLKLISLFVLPLAFGPLWEGELVTVFAFFYLRKSGIYWYLLNMAYSLILFTFGILGPAIVLLFENKSWKKKLTRFYLPMDLLLLGFFFLMYSVLFGPIMLLAPGLIGLLIGDITIYRKIKES